MRRDTLSYDRYLDQPAAKEILDEIRRRDWSRTPVSDIRDEAGHQYVDLVMEGGGTLGIALAGYTCCLEQAGIRFLSIAGTSAGAINALLLAAADSPSNERAGKIIDLLADLDLRSFMDGNIFAKALISIWQLNTWWGLKALLSLLPGLVELPILLTHYGLNPGKTFQQWLAEAVGGFGTHSLQRLRETMAPPSDLRLKRHDGQAHEGDDRPFSARLAIIASDVSTRTKADFPRMARLYWARPDDLNPAIFARASMSVPFFFRPLKVPSPIRDQELLDQWDDMTGYKGPLPRHIRFLDGGILSNFPIYAFHDYRYVPRAPTFGVKLGLDRQSPSGIKSIIGLTTAAFRSTQKVLDYDFINNNPEYRQLICQIDTGEHDWLNFRLTEEAKLDLFARGVSTAAKFLMSFKDRWGAYKEYRLGQTRAARKAATL